MQPNPAEEPVATHRDTTTRLVPLGFAYANGDTALGLSQGFKLLLLVPYTACSGVEIFEICFVALQGAD